MAQVTVNQETCISCGTCWMLDEAHFVQDGSGKASVRLNKNDDKPAASKKIDDCKVCKDAEASCPTQSIKIE